MVDTSNLVFFLNGTRVCLENVDPTMLLIDYLRLPEVSLTGTKLVCGEGGCGACTVVMAHKDRRTGQVVERPVNACLRPLCSVDGTMITTTEGLGSTYTGHLNPIQEKIADGNGSQCGYCTPGWVMTMYGLLRNNRQPTSQEVEDYFSGNLCRCTGYRSILNAMQSFVGDRALQKQAAGESIDPNAFPFKESRRLHFHRNGYEFYRPLELHEVLELLQRYRATPSTVKLVNGNTSVAIYKREVYDPKVLIDVSQIVELTELGYRHADAGIVIGGGITLTTLKRFLAEVIQSQGPVRTRGLVEMEACLARLAGEQVRGVGTVAGNIMLVKNHETEGVPFTSDLFTMLATLGAVVVLRAADDPEQEQRFPILEMPLVDSFPSGFVITKVLIPFTSKGSMVQTYKVSRRLQNAHALVNAGFHCEFGPSTEVERATLIFGGIGRLPINAKKTATLLLGKPWSWATYEAAVQVLREEIAEKIVPKPEDRVSTEYRKALAEALFYKYFVYVANQIAPQEVPPDEISAGQLSVRPVSSGTHCYVQAPYYDGEPLHSRISSVSMNPGTPSYAVARTAAAVNVETAKIRPHVVAVNRPDPTPEERPPVSISARVQATGEARYTQDEPGPPGMQHAAYVYSTCRNGMFNYGSLTVEELNIKLRSECRGFHTYITEADIPQKSGHDTYKDNDPGSYDPIFASGRVTAYGQPIGLVVADTLQTAQRVAAQVQHQIQYDTTGFPAIETIEQALALPDRKGILSGKYNLKRIERKDSGDVWLANPQPEEGKVFITGTQYTGAQAHFYMETQTALAIPGEMGSMTLYISAQHLASCQNAVAAALGLPANQVEVKATRVGGGYGGKEIRPPTIAAATAVAAHKLNRPVRLALDRNTDMIMIGKRHPFKGTYHLSADSHGRIEKLRIDFWSDAGFSYDCSLSIMDMVLLSADGAYNVPTFQANGTVCRTNRATNTAFRSFGVIQCSLILEEAIEHLAYQLGKSPEAVRELNFYQDATIDSFDLTPYGQELRDCRIHQIWADLRNKANVDARSQAVQDFNKAHRWRKRGIAMMPIKYGVSYTYLPLNQATAEVMVYNGDGSVLVHHGGIEMGQGLDTKILQIAAETLGIPYDLIQIAHADTSTVPNASSTGASTGADLQGGAVLRAAKKLRKRLVDFCKCNQHDPSSGIPPNWEKDWAGSWKAIVQAASGMKVDLSSKAHFASPNLEQLDPDHIQLAPGKQVFYYFTYSAAVSEVEIDVLTGEFMILRSDIIYDAGQSINTELDFGQVEGGFIQGVGNVTTEEIYYASDGRPYSDGTWHYKPPCSKTIPIEFNANLLQYVRTDHRTDTPMDKYGIMSSKSTGEPPFVLANSVFFAIKHAIMAARQAAGWHEWFELESPATVERIRQACWSFESPAPTT
jgi:xanthine dehydrogenase/oxidase